MANDNKPVPAVAMAVNMSMRDYFAIQALTGFATQRTGHYPTLQEAVVEAYRLADLMLVERERKP